jgi:flagellar biosynthesis protein FlhG
MVTSGKGGVGKSTIALNSAICLANQGYRTLLVDADDNLGSLDIMLGLAPMFRLGHVLRGERSMEEVLISVRPNLKVLPASSGDIGYPGRSVDVHQRLIDELGAMEEACDVILIDTGAGLNQGLITFARESDEILVVSGPEPTSVMDAYAVMKVIWSEVEDASIRLILNNVRTPKEAEEVASKLQLAVAHFLRRDVLVLGSVPADGNVQRAVIQQQPLMLTYPRSGASLSIQALARGIVQTSSSRRERKVLSE